MTTIGTHVSTNPPASCTAAAAAAPDGTKRPYCKVCCQHAARSLAKHVAVL